jgi:hypothetical protein
VRSRTKSPGVYLYIYQHTYHQHNQNLKWFRSISPCLR